MTKATETFTVRDDEGNPHTFHPGDTVPDDIAAIVGDHVIDVRPDAEPVGASVEELTAAGADEKLLAQLAEKDKQIEAARAENETLTKRVGELEAEVEKLAEVRDAIASGDLSGVDLDSLGQSPSSDDGGDVPTFDPSEHDVPTVLAYLETADEDEDARVRAAEKAGKNRKTILGEE